MGTRAPAEPLAPPGDLLAGLDAGRARTLALVAPLSDDQLAAVHSTLMSPLVWDLGHIAAFEDLWLVHRLGGEPMLREDLGATYDAFETPRARRGELDFLDPPGARDYLAAVRERALELIERDGVGDGLIVELVVRHERQHQETMLQTLCLARIEGYEPPAPRALPAAGEDGAARGLELVEVPAGPFQLGAPETGFAYDNERPRHEVHLDAFLIGRSAVTNGEYAEFVEAGGYGRREWWSEEGWAWKQREGIAWPGGWLGDGREWRLRDGAGPLVSDAVVEHVSFHEAQAFARAHGARLPTEAEWEKAAVWDPDSGATAAWPWGEGPAADPGRANVEQTAYGTAPAGGMPAGASPCGALGMIGDTWEWTASAFGGYPGFRAHPYREYSEVFFGGDYRVLRGGSWASSGRVATPTFRNWDYPQRRQIFTGIRIARD